MFQFVFGPVITGDGILMSNILNSKYVLVPDPNPSFGPYFALATGQSSYLPIVVKITTPDETNTSGVNLTSGGMGFIYDVSQQNTILSSTSNGNIKYSYINGASAPLTAGNTIYLSNPTQGTLVLQFGYKTPEQALADYNAYTSDPLGYKPTYSGYTTQLFYVPVKSYGSSNCNSLDTYGAYLAYSGKSTSSSVYYTEQSWCENNIKAAPCTSGQSCGTCFGFCSTELVCSPTGKGTELTCQSAEGGEEPWYTKPWFIVLMVLIGLAILAVIIYLIIANV
jgi:hypothetical protein